MNARANSKGQDSNLQAEQSESKPPPDSLQLEEQQRNYCKPRVCILLRTQDMTELAVWGYGAQMSPEKQQKLSQKREIEKFYAMSVLLSIAVHAVWFVIRISPSVHVLSLKASNANLPGLLFEVLQDGTQVPVPLTWSKCCKPPAGHWERRKKYHASRILFQAFWLCQSNVSSLTSKSGTLSKHLATSSAVVLSPELHNPKACMAVHANLSLNASEGHKMGQVCWNPTFETFYPIQWPSILSHSERMVLPRHISRRIIHPLSTSGAFWCSTRNFVKASTFGRLWAKHSWFGLFHQLRTDSPKSKNSHKPYIYIYIFL